MAEGAEEEQPHVKDECVEEEGEEEEEKASFADGCVHDDGDDDDFDTKSAASGFDESMGLSWKTLKPKDHTEIVLAQCFAHPLTKSLSILLHTPSLKTQLAVAQT